MRTSSLLVFFLLSLLFYTPPPNFAYSSSAIPLENSKDLENQKTETKTEKTEKKNSVNKGLSRAAVAGIAIATILVAAGTAIGIPAALGSFGAVVTMTTQSPLTTTLPFVTTEYIDPLLDYVPKNCSRPNLTTTGPKIVFRWDDGHGSLYPFALNLFRINDVPATVLVITDFVGKPDYLSWEQIAEMKSKNWEIGSHSKTHANLTAVNRTQLEDEIKGSKKVLESRGYNVSTFAFPFGAQSSETDEVVNTWYELSLGFPGESYNAFAFNDAHLGALSYEFGTNQSQFIAKIKEGKEKKALMFIALHKILKENEPEYRWGIRQLDLIALVDKVLCLGIPVISPKDLLSLPKIDLLTNGHFSEPLSSGWLANDNFVFRDDNNKGKAPESKYSVKLIGNPLEKTELVSQSFSINNNKTYQVGAFVNTRNLTETLNFYVSEYNNENEWISGVYLGHIPSNQVTVFRANYSASSSSVKKIDVQAYLNPGENGFAFLDRFEFLLVE